MKPILRREAEYTDCKFCKNSIKKTRHNRSFCNDSCRIRHHMKKQGKKVMLLSKEEVDVVMEMRRKNGTELSTVDDFADVAAQKPTSRIEMEI